MLSTLYGVYNTVKKSPLSIVKFYVIKLILLCLVNLCATLAAFLISTIVQPFESLVYRVILNGIPFVFFMYFMFTVESRIKLPEDKEKITKKYFMMFALRELSVYFIFLIPLLALYLNDPDFIYGDGFLTLFYDPHALFFHIARGLNDIVKIIIPSLIFGAVAFAAHYIKYKKTMPADTSADSKSSDIMDTGDVINGNDDT